MNGRNIVVYHFCSLVLFTIGSTEDICIKGLTVERLTYSRLCTRGTRWLTTNFLSMAIWVIFDQEGTIMFVMHRVHYRPLRDSVHLSRSHQRETMAKTTYISC